MRFFDIGEIKKRASCIDIAENLLGLKVVNERCAATWRGGDNESTVKLNKEGFYDHKVKHGGSVVDLVCTVNGCDFIEATELLGNHLGIEPTENLKEVRSRKIDKEYIYTDADGKPIHKTVRWEPKDFTQSRFVDGEWVSGLSDIELLPYNLPKVAESKVVYINEGEKAAEACMSLGLVGTTFALGAENWKPYYAKHFKDKQVVVIADNDDSGDAHSKRICWELREVAKGIKAVKVSDVTKGDCADFVEAGGTQKELIAIVKEAKNILGDDLDKPESVKTESLIDIAKEANKTPFANYHREVQTNESGDSKTVKKPTPLNKLISDVKMRLLDFPRIVGTSIFDHDRDSKQIRYIENSQSLQAWISEKTKQNVLLGKMEGVVTIEQLYSSLFHNCQKYEMISGVPNYPMRDDVYYTHDSLPEATPDAKYFNDLCGFFEASSKEDELLIKAMFASPLYYKPMVDKPLWIVDSTTGPGSGKSKLVDMLSLLYGDPSSPDSMAPIEILPDTVNNDTYIERVNKRILSKTGRGKRIARVDNVTGFFKSDTLATMITQPFFSGMSPYSRGEETRPNDLMFVLTSNQAQVNSDLISRGFIVKVKKPSRPMKNWETEVTNFINAHRLQIIADIIGVLKKGSDIPSQGNTRFRIWEKEILLPILKLSDNYSAVWKETETRRADADGELVEADIVRDAIHAEIERWQCSPTEDVFWLPTPVLTRIIQEAIPGYGGRTGRGVLNKLKNAYHSGRLPELHSYPEKYPHNKTDYARPSRGLLWDNMNKYVQAKKNRSKVNVHILALRNEKIEMIG